MGVMTRLTSLTLDVCALKELPCFGGMIVLRHLSLENPHTLTRLPSLMDKLVGLRSLRLVWCRGITELPSICSLLSLETLHIENCALLSIAVLTALHTLVLASLPRLRALPTSIGALTVLTKPTLCDCALTDVPSSIESLTQLCTLALDIPAAPQQDVRVFKTLACALPALHLLQHLCLRGLPEDDVVVIGRSLKAWPLPLLDLNTPLLYQSMRSERCWEALTLPPEAAGWDNTAILQHWRVQQHKAVAFASGLHVRLGSTSRVSTLNDMALVLITNEVLGG